MTIPHALPISTLQHFLTSRGTLVQHPEHSRLAFPRIPSSISRILVIHSPRISFSKLSAFSFPHSPQLFTTFPTMNRTQVIVHPYDMAQPDWVRCILPCLQFMGKNDFQIIPSITEIICTNKDALKQTRAVVLQKPTAPGRAQIALYYAKLKKECGFKLVTDMDDLLWGSFSDYRVLCKAHPEPRPDDAHESQAGVAVVRHRGLFHALPC